MANTYSSVDYITNYRGELADRYETQLDYVENGDFEKDYFCEWTESLSDYPFLCEIMEFATKLDSDIKLWLEGVEAGAIDSEANR